MTRAPLPAGNDPRLKLEPDELEAASVRAMPQVARASGLGDNLGLAAGLLGAVALGGIVWISLSAPPKPRPQPQQPPTVQQPAPQSVLPPIDPSLNPQPEAPPAFVTPQPVTQPVPPPAAVTDPNAARAPALIIDNSTPEAANAAAPNSGAQAAAAPKALNANDQFLASQNTDVSQKATKIGDPSKVVPQGAVIPAVLETAINSDLPGYTRAIVSRDIRSFDGTAVLIPRGSRLVGQYKSGLTSGETRAFIIWNRLIRPDGLSINLASPATDDLGQAGMSGKVDSHFAKRFGSAMLLSVVNGLSAAFSSKNSSTIVIGTSSDAQGVIGDALSNDIKIPPTIKVPQGASIQVFAARDLDFNLGQ